METAFNTTLVVLPILYTLLVVAYARIFVRGPSGGGGIARIARSLLVGTVAVHLASILLRSLMIGTCPLGSRAEFLSLVAFSVGLTYLFLEVRIGERSTGVFAVTPAFVLQVIAAVSMLGADPASASSVSALESVHTFAAVVAFSAVAVCGVYALLYLFLYTAIKTGRFGLFYRRMPSLEALSDLNFVAAGSAFVALTVTIGVGFWSYFSAAEGSVALVRPEIVLTSLLWALYGCCIAAKRFLGVGGKRLAYGTALGLVLLLGILFGGFFAGGFHG